MRYAREDWGGRTEPERREVFHSEKPGAGNRYRAFLGRKGREMRRHESRLFKPGERITVDDVTRILKDAGPVDDVEGIQILKELNGYRRVDVIVSLKARE